MDLTSDGLIHVQDNSDPVSETHRRVAEIIQDYDPYLELHWIPPGSRGPLDSKPWAVVHRPPGKPAYYVLFAEDADERLLARLFSADNRDKNVLAEMDKMNDAVQALKLKKEMEERQDSHDLAASILRSRKIHYRHNGVDYGELR